MSTSSTYLTPPPMTRPVPKRLLSLQNRPAPYSNPSSLSAASPTPASGSSQLKRPGGMKRSHSFCAASPNTPYALASTSSCSHLSADKQTLVAPPLERTLSSMGSRGNHSTDRMVRPVLSESHQNVSTQLHSLEKRDPAGADTEQIPKILIHPSTTPPRRPSIHPLASPSPCSSIPSLIRDNADSRSSSYITPITPMTPSLEPSTVSLKQLSEGKAVVEDVQGVEEGVRELLV